MSATYDDSGDPLADIELKSTVVAEVELSRCVTSPDLWEVELIAGVWPDRRSDFFDIFWRGHFESWPNCSGII